MVAVIPKDHHCIIEIRAKDLRKVHHAMQMATHVKPLVEGSGDKEAWEYFAGTFFEFVHTSVEELDKNELTRLGQ